MAKREHGPLTRPDKPAETGMSVAEMLVAILVVAVLFFVFILVFNEIAFNDNDRKLSLLGSAKAMHAEKRLQELHNSVLLFTQRYGGLPGDYSGRGLPEPRGNGNGRIEEERGETAIALRDLRGANPEGDADALLLLGQPANLVYLERSPFSPPSKEKDEEPGFEPGNYLRVRGLETSVCKAVDERLDNGMPETGSLLVVPETGNDVATLYYKVHY